MRDAVCGVVACADRGVPPDAALQRQRGVWHTEDVSAAAIRRPGTRRGEDEVREMKA